MLSQIRILQKQLSLSLKLLLLAAAFANFNLGNFFAARSLRLDSNLARVRDSADDAVAAALL